MILPLFHLSVALFDAYTLWYDQKYVKMPPAPNKVEDIDSFVLKGRYLFLTLWCLVYQTFYFTVAFINDVIGTNVRSPKKPPAIRIIKDSLFSVAFPFALFVGIAFWSIAAYDKDLILPERVSKVFPSWINHSMHTMIVPFVILELILSPITYPPKKVSLSIGFLITFGYLGLLASIYYDTGSLIYPVLNVLSPLMRIVFLTISSLVALGLFLICEMIHNLVQPKVSERIKSASKVSGKKVKKIN